MTSTPDVPIPLTRLTGRFVAPDGTALSGTISFAPPTEVTLPGSNVITSSAATVTLDPSGAFSVDLIPTDTPGMSPYGWAYRVTEKLKGQPRREYTILLPASPAPVDLADIAPASPYAGNYRAVIGPAGPKGDKGDPGPAGPKGDKGDPGGGEELIAHEAATTDVHGIADTAALETQSGAQAKADAAQSAAEADAAAKYTPLTDARLSDARTPTGPAGGALQGTYPNPSLSDATLASFDPAGSASSAQAAAATDASNKISAHSSASDPHGDRAWADGRFVPLGDARLTDSRPPSGPAGGALTGTYPNPTLSDATVAAFDPAGAASSAQAAAEAAASTDAANKVSGHASATDPHGDRAWASSTFATITVVDTLTGQVTTLQGSVSNLDTFVNDCLTRVSHIEQGTAWLQGVNSTGLIQVVGNNLLVKRADGTGAYQLRVTGGGLDFEVGGMDVTVSTWSNADMTGTQTPVMRWEPAGPHLIGRTQFGTNPYDDVHEIDATTGVASLGAKNGLFNLRFCGRRGSAGAPTTGTWAAGDLVLDSAGVWYLCTAAGTPGTWVSGSSTPAWVFDITKFGAVSDAKIVTDGAVSAGVATLTCATSAPFTSAMVGQPVLIEGAGPSGVTAFRTTFASYTSATSMGLTDAPPSSITGATVVWGTNNYAAVRAATQAAEDYLAAGHPFADVYTPPTGGYVIDGPLDTSKSGNGQVAFGVYATTAGKKSLRFRSDGSGAGVRHWEQLVPQISGGTWISFGFYSSTSAQITDLNANGNPGIISGPNEGTSNGLAYGAAGRYSNIMPVIQDMAFLVPHSGYGLTRGAWNFYGCANAVVENVSVSTLGVVPSSSDYTSPGVFGTGLSIAALMPSPGNNDLTLIRNLSIQGGFTYGLFFSEHTLIDRIMVLYCWAGLCPVGSYAGSVGSVHAMKVLSASIEACTHEVYIVGAGSEGVGPIIDIDQLSTESSTPNIAGNSAAALSSARGRIKLTGLFNPAGVSVQGPTGIELVNGQDPRAIKRKTASFAASPIDRTLICDTTAGGAFTATLPAADFNPVEYVLRNVGGNALTVASTGGQTINTSSAVASTVTVPAGGTLRVQAMYDGSAWVWYAV